MSPGNVALQKIRAAPQQVTKLQVLATSTGSDAIQTTSNGYALRIVSKMDHATNDIVRAKRLLLPPTL
jgi:hypothetical protein